MDERLHVKLRELAASVGAIKASGAAMCSEHYAPSDRHTFNRSIREAQSVLTQLVEIGRQIKTPDA